MALQLYAHPFSSYCQKVLIALYENATPFAYRLLSPDNPQAMSELEAHWPFRRFPLLLDGERAVSESSIIIEYLQQHYPGTSNLLPEEAAAALEVRFMDRAFDLYVSTPMQACVFDQLRPAEQRDTFGVAQARQLLVTAYRWFDGRLDGRQWAAGSTFSLADCAAAPALFYADWIEPIGAEFATLRAYRQRLLARPSFARAVDEARPYRHLFPLGAPERD
ncbi:glutathione S-transferase [Pseudomonas alcaligenes]|uniref:Glutathione S-transferase n=1 Tax=Aquipseudomonas alcaligenes TaxID=43263 RepID=A0ABR7RZJ8_AQUAC|nr:glutathione S-transferase family protein [Pseudomonas alcaligenes]MBC9250750.1 glutathione S-transferase [Pseudomonas alcaligenes]